MKKLLKNLLPQKFINNYYHLPRAILANVLYGFPTRKLKVIGVTGTDGKTTTTNMIYQVLKDAGKKVSMVSSINAVVGGESYDTGFHVTSPDPFTVQKFAKQAKNNGDECLVLEVTSHALDQRRFWGIKFDIGVITNITHEHLDYHKTFENYLNTKAKIIKSVNFTIVNQNLLDKLENTAFMKSKASGKIITFGLNKGDFNQKDLKLNLKIPGDYNIENALAALSVAFVLNIDKKIAQKTLENFSSLKGRMNEIKNNKRLKIIVDFAHTPNALEQALQALKEQGVGRIIAVFGCAGLRDEEKRPLMGEIATRLANLTVITAEDPRGHLREINKQIISGIDEKKHQENRDYFVKENRKEAIEFAIKKLAKPGDTVGIFGKGHENSMNLDGKVELPWSDFEAVKKALY